MQRRIQGGSDQSGFSLIELMIAMAVMLVVMAISSTLLAHSFRTRMRENRRTEALADAQRAINIMSREISNAGFGLTTNGIVAADSDSQSIRIRSNLNAFTNEAGSTTTGQADEDISYSLYADGANVMITRFDVNTATTTVLANRIDSFRLYYYDERVTYTASGCTISNVQNSAGATENQVAPALARYIVIGACVQLPAIGRPGQTGYQPASSESLVTDIKLRNADLLVY